MKKIILLYAFMAFGFLANAQTIYEEFNSDKLEQTRRIKIQLPRNYDTNLDKIYPVIIVLDADYLFEPVAGNVDYFSYWEDMPESIVVGIMQSRTRYDDCNYDQDNYLPAEKGAEFFEFIGLELLPYIDTKYRTAKFVVGVGHDFTANFLNFYLYKNPPLFNGYIVLSPELSPNTSIRMAGRIPDISSQVFYYLATATDDIKDLREGAEALNNKLKTIKSPNFNYYYDTFEGATHYSLVARGIPNALEKMFSVYRPISVQEYKNVLLTLDTPISDYLIDKYNTISDLFGINDPIRVNDYIATTKAAEKRGQWESLKVIAEMAKREYPETVLGPYYLGRYYEEIGEPKKAMRIFQGAYDKEEVGFITIDIMLDMADKIKQDFGF
tara:strand:+ start:9529 stop:10677 length:1149 start_codon:yes stop_codon:yes gene_type:complete